MSPADLTLLAAWAGFALLSCLLTLHLYRDLGALVASQAFLLTLGGLAYTLVVRASPASDVGAGLGIVVAAVLGGALGLVHVPLLRRLGPNLLLVLTAVLHIVLAQFWLALPQWTGGSGGLLLPARPMSWTPWVLLLAIALTIGHWLWLLRLPHARFVLAAVRATGDKAGALGAPVLLLYRVGFTVYGAVLGLCGAEAVRLAGFLTAEMFGLSWALTVVLIVLVASAAGYARWAIAGLAIGYAVTRIGLRQALEAGPLWAHAYDVIVPAVLLGVYVVIGQSGKKNPLPRPDQRASHG
jgi:ABC-type branched-subunit amino acid transport system permease subunit